MRSIPLMLAIGILLPDCAQAQDAEAPNGFGHRGYVTRDELAKLTFSAVEKDLALATHVPATRVPEGAPLWAYFVVKNTSKEKRGLDMRFDFVTGQTHLTVNSCGFTVKPLTEGLKLGAIIQSHMWSCGSGSLIDVDGGGYYVAAVDLGDWGKLPPGDYEVSWRHSGIASNTAKFTVLAAPDKTPHKEKRRHWVLWELDPRGGRGERKAVKDDEPPPPPDVTLRPWWDGDFSASLGSGVGGRHVTDLERLGGSDELISVQAEWKLGPKTDRVTLRFAAMDAKVRAVLDSLHIYLIADGPDNRGGGESGWDRPSNGARVTPYTLELEFLSDWRRRPRERHVDDTFQAALLIASKALQPPVRGRVRLDSIKLSSHRALGAQDRVWDGLVRTKLQEMAWR